MSHFTDNPQLEEFLNEDLYELFSLISFDVNLNEMKDEDVADYAKYCYTQALCDV